MWRKIGILVGDAVAAEDVAAHARALQRHPDIVPLDHRDVIRLRLAFVLQTADLQRQQLRLGDLADHPHQLLLHELVRGDRLIAELLAELRVLQRAVVAGHGRANRAPGNAVARLVQAAQRRLQSAGLGQQVFGGDADIL